LRVQARPLLNMVPLNLAQSWIVGFRPPSRIFRGTLDPTQLFADGHYRISAEIDRESRQIRQPAISQRAFLG